MILPTALVDRWPSEEYCRQHDCIESALKHSVSDLLRLQREVAILRQIENNYGMVPIPDEFLTKDLRNFIKRSGGDTLNQEFVDYIIKRSEEFDRCLKNTDYPAMVMAAYPQARFMAKERYKSEYASIKGAILARGISSGKLVDHAKQQGLDYYFIETGYLGNYRCDNNLTGRKIYHRIVKNAMQHHTIMDVPSDRWLDLVRFNPNMRYHGWRRSGSKILVVLPTEKPFQYYGEDREKWIKTVKQTLKKHSDREIIWRQKQSRGERTNDTIYEAMADDIYAVVTYQSVAAIEAIQFGIPAFALAPTAADPVANKDLARIESPYLPDEDLVYRWLCSIAYSQFSLDEIIDGRAWRMVQENDTRPTIDY